MGRAKDLRTGQHLSQRLPVAQALEDRRLMSLTVSLQTTAGATSAVVSAGEVLALNVVATVTGTDGTATYDNLQDVEGSFLSTAVGASAVAGNLAVTGATAPFNALGSNLGTAQDLNGDGHVDVGSNVTNSSEVGGYFFARAGSPQSNGVASGAAMSFTIATLSYTVTALNGGGQTNITFRPRDTSQVPGTIAAVWTDSAAGTVNQDTGTFRAGSPFRVFSSASQSAATGTVTATAYGDTDGSGTRNGTETGIAAATAFVDVARTGAFATGDPSGLTNSSGVATITGVPAGTYDVLVVPPTGYAQSQPATGGYAVTVTAGGTASAGPFGVEPDGSVTGTVYTDVNVDGVQDAGDAAGPSGIVVFLDVNHDGSLDAGDLTAATEDTGAFTFADVPPGTYELYPAVPDGYGLTQPTAGGYSVTVPTGGTVTGGTFGLATRGIVAGTVFDDANGDGIQDDGEAGLAGITVYVDVNGNGNGPDASDPSAVTGADGTYTIGDVPGGTYALSDVVPAGDAQTAPAGGGYTITAVDGQMTDAAAFGIDVPTTPTPTATTGAITGTVDGAAGAPLAGATVYLDANSNGLLDAGEPTATTAADGTYAFAGLAPATYTVRPLVPLGDVVTAPATGSDALAVTAGGTAAATDFTVNPLPASPLTAAVASKPAAAVIAGATGTLKVRVSNGGDAAFAGPVVFDVYASTTGAVYTQDAAIGTVTKTLKLKPGKSAAVAVKYAYPLTLASGTYHLQADASTGSATAPALGEASSTVAVTAASVDLSPTIVAAAAAGVAVRPGKAGAVNVRIANGGNVTATGTVTVTLYATTTGAVDATAVVVGSIPAKKVRVAAKRTATLRVTFTAPASLAAGSYQVIAVLSATTDPVDTGTANTSAAVATR